MNIFFLDNDITLCAQYHCDKHVIKMILESAQILCTILHQNGIEAAYRPTHRNHPCTIWAGESLDNWLWLRQLVIELNKEYQYRFEHDKPHQSSTVVLELPTPPIPAIGITERPQCMPEQYKISGDPVTAYRNFYLSEKFHLLNYTKIAAPFWITKNNYNNCD